MIKIVVGRVTSRIVGEMKAEHKLPLYEALSFVVAGQFFRKKANKFAKERKYMITEKRQEFRTGLLSRVCDTCDVIGIEYEIIDKREVGPPDHFMPLGDNASMRDYQDEAIEISINERAGMVRVATGGGKTRIMAGIVASLERKSVILVHRLDLLHQVVDVLSDLLQYREVIGVVGGGVYEPGLITVCTVQTICAALEITHLAGDDDDAEQPKGAQAYAAEIKQMLDEAQVVVVDEAHHAPAQTIYEVLKRLENATWRIGLTATDWRDDKADMLIEAAIGPRIFDVSLSDLIEWGYLVAPKIVMKPLAYAGFCQSDNYNSIYSFYYTHNDLFHEQVIAQNAEWYNAGRHILTLVTSVKHGQILEYLHNECDIPSIFLSGKDTTVRRREVLDMVRSGECRHLIGTSIADEGLDLPILDALNLAGGGKSTTKAYQRIGRILRICEGKTDALVVDYRVRNEDALNSQAGRRANIYRKEPRFSFTEIKQK